MTRRSPTPRRDTAVGLALLTVSVLLIAYGLAGKPNPTSDKEIVRVEFRDASAVARFDRDVRVGGANVGTIGAVERRGDHALVDLELPPDIAATVRADATAELRPHTLFDGNAFVELDPGSPGAPPLGDRAIPLSRTRNYVSLERALRVFDEPTRRALPRLAGDLESAVGPPQARALHDTLAQAPDLMEPLAATARAAQGPTRRELRGTIGALAGTVDAVARSEDDLGGSLRAGSTTLAAIERADPALDRTLAALPSALDASHRGGQALRSTLVRLRPLAAELTPAARQLTPALVELRPLLREALPVARDARPFLRDLRTTLRSAARASAPATALLRRVQPILRVTQLQLLPALASRTNGGVPIYRALAGMIGSTTGTLSPVKTLAEGKAGNAGPGHGWHMSPSALASTELTCASLGDALLSDRFQELGLCRP